MGFHKLTAALLLVLAASGCSSLEGMAGVKELTALHDEETVRCSESAGLPDLNSTSGWRYLAEGDDILYLLCRERCGRSGMDFFRYECRNDILFCRCRNYISGTQGD